MKCSVCKKMSYSAGRKIPCAGCMYKGKGEENWSKKPYFISEPFGLPFELTKTGKFKRLEKVI